MRAGPAGCGRARPRYMNACQCKYLCPDKSRPRCCHRNTINSPSFAAHKARRARATNRGRAGCREYRVSQVWLQSRVQAFRVPRFPVVRSRVVELRGRMVRCVSRVLPRAALSAALLPRSWQPCPVAIVAFVASRVRVSAYPPSMARAFRVIPRLASIPVRLPPVRIVLRWRPPVACCEALFGSCAKLPAPMFWRPWPGGSHTTGPSPRRHKS